MGRGWVIVIGVIFMLILHPVSSSLRRTKKQYTEQCADDLECAANLVCINDLCRCWETFAYDRHLVKCVTKTCPDGYLDQVVGICYAGFSICSLTHRNVKMQRKMLQRRWNKINAKHMCTEPGLFSISPKTEAQNIAIQAVKDMLKHTPGTEVVPENQERPYDNGLLIGTNHLCESEQWVKDNCIRVDNDGSWSDGLPYCNPNQYQYDIICQLGWITKGNKQYKVLESFGKEPSKFLEDPGIPFQYEHAKATCSKHGGILPEPRNKDENDALVSLNTKGFYLGMTCAFMDQWVWNSDHSKVNWFNWKYKSSDPNCAGMAPSGPWAAGSCATQLLAGESNVVCEKVKKQYNEQCSDKSEFSGVNINYYWQPCAANLLCVRTKEDVYACGCWDTFYYNLTAGKCFKSKLLGEPCEGYDCLAGGYCVTYKGKKQCAERKTSGESCKGRDCLKGLHCATDNGKKQCIPLKCPDGFTQYGDHCYKPIKEKKNFADAYVWCRYNGGNLAEPRTRGEHEDIQASMHDTRISSAWLGGFLPAPAVETWIWLIDGLDEVTYDGWRPNYPSSDNLHRHMYMVYKEGSTDNGWQNGGWNDRLSSICQPVSKFNDTTKLVGVHPRTGQTGPNGSVEHLSHTSLGELLIVTVTVLIGLWIV